MARARIWWLVPIGVVAAATVVASTNPPARSSLPAPVARSLASLEGWFDEQDHLGTPCSPDAPSARAAPGGMTLDVPACWTLTTAGALFDPGLAVDAVVDAPRPGAPAWDEMMRQWPARPDETYHGHLYRFSVPLAVGDSDPLEVFLYFVTDTAALRVQASVHNEFALSPKVAAHFDRLGDVAKTAR